MAISFVGSDFWDSTHSSPVAGTPTIPSLTDGILIVSVADFDPGGDALELLDGISSDQDGALQQLGSNVNNGAANAQIWYLLNPTAAVHTLTPSYADSAGNKPTSLIAHWWSGVDQTTPFGTPATNTGSSDSPTVTATTASGEVVIDSLCTNSNSAIDTNGADQTQIETNFVSDSNTIRGHCSRQDGANGGVMSYTLLNSRDWAILAAPLKPSAGDTTAPTLSSPSGIATGETTADLSVSTDEGNGTLYWVVTESATAPSVAQIQAGQDDSGTAAADSGNQAVSATGTQNASATGLAAGTTYTAHFQHQDAAANDSAVVSSATFTTDSAGSASLLDSSLIRSPLTHSRLVR